MLRTLAAALALLFAVPAAAAEKSVDVVVYGGTSAGVAAAVQAARMGKIGRAGRARPPPRRTHQRRPRLHRHRQQAGHRRPGPRVLPARLAALRPTATPGPGKRRRVPPTGQALRRRRYDVELRAARGRSRFSTRCSPRPSAGRPGPASGPEKRGRERGAADRGHRAWSRAARSAGRMFIDATYEGDLMAKAGVSYTRRPRGATPVRRNAQRRADRHAQHATNSSGPVDPYVMPGDPASGLLPGIHAGAPGRRGPGDRRVQAYNFRMCLTDVPENRVPFPKPAGYDPRRYELLLRYLDGRLERRASATTHPMPNRKSDTNNHGAIRHRRHRHELRLSRWRLRHARARSSASTRRTSKGCCGSWPTIPACRPSPRTGRPLGTGQGRIRRQRPLAAPALRPRGAADGRRLRDDRTRLPAQTCDARSGRHGRLRHGLAQRAALRRRRRATPATRAMSRSSPRRPLPDQLPRDRAEGRPVHEPAGAGLPVGQSHIAYGSIRMEPVFMVLGQSAATAAALAIEQGSTVQAVDYGRLHDRLIKDKQILNWRPQK